jgi:hypothetical protein
VLRDIVEQVVVDSSEQTINVDEDNDKKERVVSRLYFEPTMRRLDTTMWMTGKQKEEMLVCIALQAAQTERLKQEQMKEDMKRKKATQNKMSALLSTPPFFERSMEFVLRDMLTKMDSRIKK